MVVITDAGVELETGLEDVTGTLLVVVPLKWTELELLTGLEDVTGLLLVVVLFE